MLITLCARPFGSGWQASRSSLDLNLAQTIRGSSENPMNDVFRLSTWRLLVALVLCCAADASTAVTVHTWVDADGVRHFADAPPAAAGTSSSEITIDGGATPLADDVDYYSISNQWQRLRAERESLDALALEQRRIDAVPPFAPAPVVQDSGPRSVFYPNFFGLPPRFGPPYPAPVPARGYPSPRNAFVNTPPPVWPRER